MKYIIDSQNIFKKIKKVTKKQLRFTKNQIKAN